MFRITLPCNVSVHAFGEILSLFRFKQLIRKLSIDTRLESLIALDFTGNQPKSKMTNGRTDLEHILNATETLRQSLSLSQLVPVYDSILKISKQNGVDGEDDELASTLQHTATSGERLLQIQYRLFHSNHLSVWDRLNSIVIPSVVTTTNNKKTSDDETAMNADLLDAVLDALFLEVPKFEEGLEVSLESLTSQEIDWNASCRILAAIAHHFPHQKSHAAVRSRLCQVFERPIEDLPIVVDTLLPLIDKQETDELWDVMEHCYETKLIHCSTFLCCIPLEKHRVWLKDLIFKCLGHPNRVLRRRGIYILSQVAGDSSWKDYATCFEALEMESETHLLQPVWDAIETLQIPHDWMQVLCRSSLDFAEANNRKTNLHRFLTMKTPPKVTMDFVTHSLIPAVDSIVASGSIGILFGGSKRTMQRTTLLDLLCTFLNQFLKDVEDWTDFMVAFWKTDLLEKTRDAVNCSLVWGSNNTVQVSQSLLESVIQGRRHSTVSRRLRRSMLKSLAVMLSHGGKTSAPPKLVLCTLALFIIEGKPVSKDIEEYLKKWLVNYPASVVATALVDGQLLDGMSLAEQDVRSGYITPTEIELAPAAAYASRLTQQPLWPAIAKGMGNSLRMERMARAILLIEYGCRHECISGMGNGALLMDKQEHMMPPPPNIEELVLAAVSFTEATIIKLLETSGSAQTSGRSDEAKTRSLTFCRMVSHLEAICKGFPNSSNLDDRLISVVQRCRSVENVSQLAVLYSVLAGGAAVEKTTELVATILNMKLPQKPSNTTRTVFVLAKWGSLSQLIPAVDCSTPENRKLLDSFLEEALDAVDSVPRNAAIPLFICIVNAGKAQLAAKEKYSASLIKKLSDAMFGIMEETQKMGEQMYMLDQLCRLIFEPTYLFAEYAKLENKGTSKAPIRSCFRRMMEMAGTNRPHIARIVLLRACASWLHPHPEGVGLTAIPYRDDVLYLLQQKEKPIDDDYELPKDGSEAQDPTGLINAQSLYTESGVSRSILLVFLSRLPTSEHGLSDTVLSDFVHFLLFKAIDVARSKPSCSSFVQLGVSGNAFHYWIAHSIHSRPRNIWRNRGLSKSCVSCPIMSRRTLSKMSLGEVSTP